MVGLNMIHSPRNVLILTKVVIKMPCVVLIADVASVVTPDMDQSVLTKFVQIL